MADKVYSLIRLLGLVVILEKNHGHHEVRCLTRLAGDPRIAGFIDEDKQCDFPASLSLAPHSAFVHPSEKSKKQ